VRPAALALAAALVAVVLPTSLAAGTQAAGPSAQPAPAVPTTVVFDEAVDNKAEYQGQALCEPAPKPGTKALGALITATYPKYPTIGYERDCSVGGQSEHKDGRALDWMLSVRDPAQKATAEAFLDWLLAPDANGVDAAMARRIGVMYIGWDDRIWRGYGTMGWSELFDCETNAARATTAYDNYCHRNHIHISLTWDGARAWTSFYDRTPLTTPVCAAPAASPTAPASSALQLVPVRATRILDTSTAAGVPDVCRASGPSWSGQRRAVAAKVTGIGSIPRSGVGAVLVRVYPLTTNTTTSLSVWTAGASAPSTAVASSGYANRSVASTYVVPVASDGTIRVQSAYGATHVVVDVLAWAPTATALAAASTAGGNIHVQASTRALTVTVDPASTALVDLAGVAGVPASGLVGVQLQVSAAAAASGLSGAVRVGSVSAAGAAELPRRFTVAYTGLVVRSAAVTVATTGGRIALRNDGANPATVTVDVTGWYGDGADTTGARIVPRSPLKVLDTATGFGIKAPLAAGTPATLTLSTTSLPAGTTGAVLAVSTRGVAGSGSLTVTGGADASGRSGDVISSIWTTDLVVVPVGADRRLTFSTTAAGGADVRAILVATLR
jgi:hypothetical protein